MTKMKSYRMREIDLDTIEWLKERLKYQDTDTKVIQTALWYLEQSIKAGKSSYMLKDEYLLDKS